MGALPPESPAPRPPPSFAGSGVKQLTPGANVGVPPVAGPVSAFHVTVAVVSPADSVSPVGANGTPTGMLTTCADWPVPRFVTVVTRNVYTTPLVSPVTVPLVLVETPSANVDQTVGSLVSL
jgi:hypothetical protein